MMRKILCTIIIFSILFGIVSVMAEDSVDSGSSGSSYVYSGNSSTSESSDSSSHNAGSSTGSQDVGSGHQAGSADNPQSVDNAVSGQDRSASSSSDNPTGTTSSGGDTSSGSKGSGHLSGPDLRTSSESTGTSSAGPTEPEIQHGISIITAQENAQLDTLSSQHAGGQDPSRQSRDATAIATASLASLSSLKGTQASQLAAQASTIQDSLPHLSAAEQVIATRNGIVTYLFGGDRTSAYYIRDHVNEDLAALDSMDLVLNDPSVSPSLKSFAVQREDLIRADLSRLMGIADSELQKKGLFG